MAQSFWLFSLLEHVFHLHQLLYGRHKHTSTGAHGLAAAASKELDLRTAGRWTPARASRTVQKAEGREGLKQGGGQIRPRNGSIWKWHLPNPNPLLSTDLCQCGLVPAIHMVQVQVEPWWLQKQMFPYAKELLNA